MSLEVIHGPLATASEGFNALESRRLAATLFFFSEVSATLWQNSWSFFSYIFLGIFVYIEYLCRPSEASTRYRTVSSQVATHLRTDRVCRVLGRSWIWTQDHWFAVRWATIDPPLLLKQLIIVLLRLPVLSGWCAVEILARALPVFIWKMIFSQKTLSFVPYNFWLTSILLEVPLKYILLSKANKH